MIDVECLYVTKISLRTKPLSFVFHSIGIDQVLQIAIVSPLLHYTHTYSHTYFYQQISRIFVKKILLIVIINCVYSYFPSGSNFLIDFFVRSKTIFLFPSSSQQKKNDFTSTAFKFKIFLMAVFIL